MKFIASPVVYDFFFNEFNYRGGKEPELIESDSYRGLYHMGEIALLGLKLLEEKKELKVKEKTVNSVLSRYKSNVKTKQSNKPKNNVFSGVSVADRVKARNKEVIVEKESLEEVIHEQMFREEPADPSFIIGSYKTINLFSYMKTSIARSFKVVAKEVVKAVKAMEAEGFTYGGLTYLPVELIRKELGDHARRSPYGKLMDLSYQQLIIDLDHILINNGLYFYSKKILLGKMGEKLGVLVSESIDNKFNRTYVIKKQEAEVSQVVKSEVDELNDDKKEDFKPSGPIVELEEVLNPIKEEKVKLKPVKAKSEIDSFFEERISEAVFEEFIKDVNPSSKEYEEFFS